MIRTLFAVFIFSGFYLPFARANSFTDESLNYILMQSEVRQSAGLIYAWSPRMNISIRGALEIFEIAQKLNLELTFVLDPAAVDVEARAVMEKYPALHNTFKLQSSVLVAMSMKIHYPSLVLYQYGNLLPISRPGYDEPARVINYLSRRLQ